MEFIERHPLNGEAPKFLVESLREYMLFSNICFQIYRIGKSNDDTSSEEHFKNSKISRGSYLELFIFAHIFEFSLMTQSFWICRTCNICLVLNSLLMGIQKLVFWWLGSLTKSKRQNTKKILSAVCLRYIETFMWHTSTIIHRAYIGKWTSNKLRM